MNKLIHKKLHILLYKYIVCMDHEYKYCNLIPKQFKPKHRDIHVMNVKYVKSSRSLLNMNVIFNYYAF